MPRNVTITFEDGSTHVYQGVPDDATPDQVTARASKEFGKGIASLDGGRSAAIEPHRGATPRKVFQANADLQRSRADDQARRMPVDPFVPGGADWAGDAPYLRGAAAIPEAAASIASGAVATPVAGLAGIASAPFANDPAAVIRRVQEALTYSPRTEGGRQVAGAAAYPFEKLAQGADAAGDLVRRATGSEILATGVNTAIQAAPSLLLNARVRNGLRRPDRVGSDLARSEGEAGVPPVQKAGRQPGLEPVRQADQPPTLEELKTLKDQAYKRAEETGIVVSHAALNRLKTELVNDLKKEGLNRKLHPKAAAALEEIVNTKGQLTLSQFETLRKIANDAKGSIEPADSRLGAHIVDKIDDFESSLGEADIVSGDASAATAFKEARALNTRYSKAQQINELFDRARTKAGANYTQSGLENALRQEFKALALNKNKMRRFTPEERASIKRVATGAPLENALRWVGKMAPTGTIGQFAGLGAAAAVGPAGLAVPAIGLAGKHLATRATLRNASRAESIMRTGPDAPKLINRKAPVPVE